MFYQATQIAYT